MASGHEVQYFSLIGGNRVASGFINAVKITGAHWVIKWKQYDLLCSAGFPFFFLDRFSFSLRWRRGNLISVQQARSVHWIQKNLEFCTALA